MLWSGEVLQHPHSNKEHLSCQGAAAVGLTSKSPFSGIEISGNMGLPFGWPVTGDGTLVAVCTDIGVKVKLLIWPLDNRIEGSGSLLPFFFLPSAASGHSLLVVSKWLLQLQA